MKIAIFVILALNLIGFLINTFGPAIIIIPIAIALIVLCVKHPKILLIPLILGLVILGFNFPIIFVIAIIIALIVYTFKHPKVFIFILVGGIAYYFILNPISCDTSKPEEPEEPAAPNVQITHFSVGYLTESAYNNGEFDASAITTDTVFEIEKPQYMVIDLNIKALADSNGNKSIKISTTASNTAAISTIIQEAETGKVESITNGEGYNYNLSYATPLKKDEEKSIKIILKIVPHREGNFWFDISISGNIETILTGETYKSMTLQVGAPS